VAAARYRARGDVLRIAGVEDLHELEALLHGWLGDSPAGQLITVEAAQDDPTYSRSLDGLIGRLEAALDS
jgi:hypothetical protein